MPRPSRALERRSFFIDPAILRRAKRALGVRTDADAVRLALEQAADTEAFWKLMDESRARLQDHPVIGSGF